MIAGFMWTFHRVFLSSDGKEKDVSKCLMIRKKWIRKSIKKGILTRKSDRETGRIEGQDPEIENVQDHDQGIVKSVVGQDQTMTKMIIVDTKTEKNVDLDQEIEKNVDPDHDQETEMAAEDHVQEIVVISTDEIESDLGQTIAKLQHHHRLVIIIRNIIVDNHEQCTYYMKNPFQDFF